MALTLTEAAKLSNDMLLQGVVETIVRDSPVLQRLPFIEIMGNGLTYNQEKTLPEIDFYDVGDEWDESTPTFEQITANLKIMAGCLAVWFVVSFLFGILLVDPLNSIQLFGYPLGFWFAQQGSIYTFVVLIFFYAWRMGQLDRQFNVHED